MKTLKRNKVPVSRRTVHIGDDRFAFDPDGKIYKNGYGLTPVGPYLYYYDKGKREKLPKDLLRTLMFMKDVTPEEAVRRARMSDTWSKTTKAGQRKRLKGINVSRQKKVYSITDRKRFKSITDASEFYGVNRSSLADAINKKRPIKGMSFKFI